MKPKKKAIVSNGEKIKMVAGALAIEILGNMLYDLLEPGWPEALNKMNELCNAISQMGFVSRVTANSSAPTPPPGQYDRWVNSILLAAVSFQAQAKELRALADEFGTPYKDVARVAAERLIGAAGSNNTVDFAELRQFLQSYCLHRHLEETVLAAAA